MKTAIRYCPLCDNQNVDVISHQEFELPEGTPLPSQYDVVACRICGFVFADTPASQADYDRFYADFSKYQDSQTAVGGGGTPCDKARMQFTASKIADTLTDKTIRILDLGCGNGGILEALRDLGYSNLTGIDPSAQCVRYLNQELHIDSAQGSLAAMPSHVGKFDLVILSHVLEHVRDFQCVVNALNDLVAPDGFIYLEVPDGCRYVDYLVAPFQEFNTEHINHFCLQTLSAMAEKLQFSTICTGEKILQAEAGWQYPAIFGFFKRAQFGLDKTALVPNPALRTKMLEYIDSSAQQMANIDSQIRVYADAGEPLIVWGTGQLTFKLLAQTSLKQAAISAFVDGNPINQGKRLLNHTIVAPLALESSSIPILLGTTLHCPMISDKIKHDLHLQNPIIILQT